MDTPVELAEVMATPLPSPDETKTETWYAVFNDPAKINAQVALGMPEDLADKLREPLHQTLSASAAKRYLMWTNENRGKPEWADNLKASGYAILRRQDVTTTPWHTLDIEELENIDEGRRAYNR